MSKQEVIFISKASRIPPSSGCCPIDGSKLDVAVGRPSNAPVGYKGDTYHACGSCSYFYYTPVA